MPGLINPPAEGVARLRLNRPEARSALNAQSRKALSDAFRGVEEDDSTRLAILCGSSRLFAAGADLIERDSGKGVFPDKAQRHRPLPDCSRNVAPLKCSLEADQAEEMEAFAQRTCVCGAASVAIPSPGFSTQ
jgi:enoyl-CoA hydratase/carnithine racemase